VRRPALLLAPALLCGCVESLQVLSPIDAGPTYGVSTVAASADDTCAIWDGGLYCWGNGEDGKLGTGDLSMQLLPVRIGPDSDWLDVQVGYQSSCGLKADASVWCWGGNGNGQLGLGLPDSGRLLVPTRVPLGFATQALALHFNHVCALAQDGSLWCWGFNAEGQLGLGDPYPGHDYPSPVAVQPGTHWLAVDTGQGHTCGIQSDGSLWCWGRNSNGELGQGPDASIQIRTPTRVGTLTDWTVVRATQNASSGIRRDGTLWTWGSDYQAPIGQRSWDVPTPVDGGNWVQISFETFDLCAIQSDATSWCWGRNLEGQLGTGDEQDRYSPWQVSGTFRQNAVGRFHRCALDAQGGLYCTGQNLVGQLGVGDTHPREVLTPVRLE
jgi:alpha-tubulin suppressor-like RCC1 family protein